MDMHGIHRWQVPLKPYSRRSIRNRRNKILNSTKNLLFIVEHEHVIRLAEHMEFRVRYHAGELDSVRNGNERVECAVDDGRRDGDALPILIVSKRIDVLKTVQVRAYSGIADIQIESAVIPIARVSQYRVIDVVTSPVDRWESGKNRGDEREWPVRKTRAKHSMNRIIRAHEKGSLRATLVLQEFERD